MQIINLKRLNGIISHFKGHRVAVLGDVMLDKYIWGNVGRISPEAPVPVVEVKKETSCLGGAGNVSYNLKSLGAEPYLVGLVGNDPEGKWIQNQATNSYGIIIDSKRPTIVKTRIIAHHQQVVRVDFEKKTPLPSKLENQVYEKLQNLEYEALVISDYNKGMITKSLMEKLLPDLQSKGIPVFVDPKVNNFNIYSSVTLLTPNHHESEMIVRHECLTNSQIEKAGLKIMKALSLEYLILKRGEQGMTVFEKEQPPVHMPARAKEVYDVTGAGDTVIATASRALLSGASILEAAVLANTAAGIVVGKIGTAALNAEELSLAYKE